MKTSINFIPIDYDSFDFQGKNYAKIIGRTDKGKRACIIDYFEPYFWVILKPKITEKRVKQIQEIIGKVKIESDSRTTRVIRTEVHDKNFLGKPVRAIKIFITNYKDAHDIADEIDIKEIEKRREYDLGYITQYIIERKLKPLQWHRIEGELLSNSEEFGGIDMSLDVDTCLKVEKINSLDLSAEFSPKVLAYDIETDEFEIGKGHILMISLVGKDFKKVLTWKNKSKKDFVENFKDEIDMLDAFIKYIKEYDPDILTGYFSDGFDLPYLRARAEKNHMKLNIGIDNSQPTFSRGAVLTGKIKGIVHIDLLKFIQHAYSQYLQSETLSLNEVAGELLGEKKAEWIHKHSSKIKEHEWENYYEYNLQDSVLTYKLAEKAWTDLIEITRIVQEPLFNVSRNTMASNFEDCIIHNLNRFNEIAEKRPIHEEIGKRRMREKYEGAFVFQPIPGLYENICFFDFTSMYASVIVSYNLSLSTFSKEKISNSNIAEIGNEKAYFNKTPGFFPELLKEIIVLRKQYKQEYAQDPNPITKARSNAFKLIANAAYGYQGFFGARYYCLEAAAATAYFARENIKKVINIINKEGYQVIYSDTDSVAFKLNKHTKEQTLNLLKEINKKLPGIMELDLEDFYKRGIWVTKRTGEFGAKKKYALINEKDKIKIRGFETVRRDWCTLARETQNKILQLILREGNEKEALEYAKKIIKEIKNREVELSKLVIRTQLKKPIEEYKSINPHVTVAKRMKELGMPVDLGMLIEYYISEPENSQKTKSGKTKALVRERAKLITEPGQYDISYYLNNQIIPAIENIFEVFKVNVKEITEGKRQKTLGEF
jgi:DNA polymerase elongation subunit (family B)